MPIPLTKYRAVFKYRKGGNVIGADVEAYSAVAAKQIIEDRHRVKLGPDETIWWKILYNNQPVLSGEYLSDSTTSSSQSSNVVPFPTKEKDTSSEVLSKFRTYTRSNTVVKLEVNK